MSRADGTGSGMIPYFFADDLGRSFGEATTEEKARVSHRGRAFRALIAQSPRSSGDEIGEPDQLITLYRVDTFEGSRGVA